MSTARRVSDYGIETPSRERRETNRVGFGCTAVSYLPPCCARGLCEPSSAGASLMSGCWCPGTCPASHSSVCVSMPASTLSGGLLLRHRKVGALRRTLSVGVSRIAVVRHKYTMDGRKQSSRAGNISSTGKNLHCQILGRYC